MKAVILYLFKDTVKRWLEQPWSPLARLLVAFLVALVAFIVLGSFDAAERAIIERMGRMGLNTIVSSRQLTGRVLPVGTRYEWLKNKGELLTMARPYVDGKSRTGLSVEIYGYDPSSLFALANLTKESRVLVTEAMPCGIEETVTLADDFEITARTIQPEGILRFIPRGRADGAVLLVPVQDILGYVLTQGGLETVIFEKFENGVSLKSCVDALEKMDTLDGVRTRIESSIELQRELSSLKIAKYWWGLSLGLIFLITLVLVFGAMAGLEYRESRYVAALLRSMGARPFLLICRQLSESFILALIAGGAAFGVYFVIIGFVAKIPGIGLTISQTAVSLPSLVAIFAGLALGAMTASVPVAIALKKPVGVILG